MLQAERAKNAHAVRRVKFAASSSERSCEKRRLEVAFSE
jgi:hypothetical protein